MELLNYICININFTYDYCYYDVVIINVKNKVIESILGINDEDQRTFNQKIRIR